MMVDLSTLKAGDSIRLRNGEVHEVTNVIYKRHSMYPYTVETQHPRIGNTIVNLLQREHDHMINGHWAFDEAVEGDIVEIIPTENVAAGVEHTLAWLEDEFQETRESLKMTMTEREERILRSRFDGDAVSPSHYQQNGKQLWDVMPDMATREEFLGYCKLNVVKYVGRYNKKNGIEDLKKAGAYCERMIRFLEEEQK